VRPRIPPSASPTLSAPLFSDARLLDVLLLIASGVRFGSESGSIRVPVLKDESVRRSICSRLDGASCLGIRSDAQVTFTLAFDGDPFLFACRPSTFAFSPPKAKVENDTVSFSYRAHSGHLEDADRRFRRDLSDIRLWLSWIERDLATFSCGEWSTRRSP